MHWTIITLFVLCGLCAAMNAGLFAFTRTVRMAGVLVCVMWAIQQGYWWRTGHDSFVLFVASDAAIIAWFLTRGRRFGIAERLIAATIPLTTALAAYAWLRGGHTAESWWANWWLVAGQMTVALPFKPLAQRFWRRWKYTVVNHHQWSDFDLRASHGEG